MNWTDLRRRELGDSDPSVLPPKIQLPMLPHAVLEFSRKAEDPDAGPGELGRIIESDSGLTCDLLKHVNSSKFGIRSKAATAQQAITTLGIRASKLFLLTAGVQHAMKSQQSRLINFQTFWLTNLERALAAREIARRLRVSPDVAFAGAMLQDFLLPVLSNEKYESYVAYSALPESQRPRLVDYEHRQFGWNHALAAAQVLLSWSFPDELICCVLMHHRGLEILHDKQLAGTSVAAVALAALIPESLHQSGDGLAQLMQLDASWPEFDLTGLSTRIDAELQELSPKAGEHFSLKRRCEKFRGKAAPAQLTA